MSEEDRVVVGNGGRGSREHVEEYRRKARTHRKDERRTLLQIHTITARPRRYAGEGGEPRRQ